MQTDLLTRIVQPGAVITTGVTLPAAYFVTNIAYQHCEFTTLDETVTPVEDGVWYELTARNVGPTAARLSALIDYEPTQSPGDVVINTPDPTDETPEG